jgi:hypothetical protein
MDTTQQHTHTDTNTTPHDTVRQHTGRYVSDAAGGASADPTAAAAAVGTVSVWPAALLATAALGLGLGLQRCGWPPGSGEGDDSGEGGSGEAGPAAAPPLALAPAPAPAMEMDSAELGGGTISSASGAPGTGGGACTASDLRPDFGVAPTTVLPTPTPTPTPTAGVAMDVVPLLARARATGLPPPPPKAAVGGGGAESAVGPVTGPPAAFRPDLESSRLGSAPAATEARAAAAARSAGSHMEATSRPNLCSLKRG